MTVYVMFVMVQVYAGVGIVQYEFNSNIACQQAIVNLRANFYPKVNVKEVTGYCQEVHK